MQNSGSAYNAFSFEKKRHELTLSFWYSSETGNRLAGFLFPKHYNDHFSEFALLYGRVYRPTDWLHLSASAGPSYYIYTDKEIGGRQPGYLSTLTTKTETFDGLGMAIKGELLFICNEDFGLGLNILGNINRDKMIGGVIINIAFGILRQD